MRAAPENEKSAQRVKASLRLRLSKTAKRQNRRGALQMKTLSLVKNTSGALLILSSVVTAAAANDGTIHFRGAIVEAGCQVENQAQKAIFSCFKDGKMQRQTLALHQLTEASLKQANASVRMKWLDASRRLGVLQITYQ
jgi:type 1 fimbria pilin